jgi:5-hydroxyisourate hydrolase
VITTHVLDTSIGKPAAGIKVSLEVLTAGSGWTQVAWGTTDTDGRVRELVADPYLSERRYRLVFDTASYFSARNVAAFFPVVIVVFEITDPLSHHHVPLLLSPFGYSTYRGS